MSDQSIWEVLRRLTLPVYLPSVAGTLGIGMMVPVLPLYMRGVGLSFSDVGVVLGAAGVGAMLGAVPSGWVMARRDERVLLAFSLIVIAAATAVLGLTTAVAAMVALRIMFGAGGMGLRLAIQTYVAAGVEPGSRGRALSLIGGSFRLSLFVGPLLGGYLADTVGFKWTFLLCGAVTAVGLAGAVERGPMMPHAPLEPPPDDLLRMSMLTALRRHWRILAKAGPAAGLAVAVRQGRYVAVPLIAAELGLSGSATGSLVAVGTGADLLLFPLSGYLMDRFGRLYAIVPSFTLVTAGLVILAYSHTALMVAVSGAVMGIGNGIGSGTMLTMASDLAPSEARGQVLSGLAVLQDTGSLLGPIIVGVSADVAGVGASALVLAGVMVVAILWLVSVVGETGHRTADP